MFGKKKKEPKIEKVFDKPSTEEETKNSADGSANENTEETKKQLTDDELFMGVDPNAPPEPEEDTQFTEKQKEKLKKIGSVKEKIAQILQSSNIEIIDENLGDEYESDGTGKTSEQQQQDYDSLKALFGSKDKNAKQELTLTIDDFDYTHVGQYLDEFDLMHIKGIKHIRLQSKHAKLIKKISIIGACVAVLGIGIFAAISLIREKPVVLESIALNRIEDDYYLNEYFDYSGLYINATYSNGKVDRIKLDSTHLKDILGNKDIVGDDIKLTDSKQVTLWFTYGGFDTSYSINIVHKKATSLDVIESNGFYNLTKDEYITDRDIKVICNYENHLPDFISLDQITLEIDGIKCVYDKNNKGFKIPVDIKEDSTIKIGYSNLSLTL